MPRSNRKKRMLPTAASFQQTSTPPWPPPSESKPLISLLCILNCINISVDIISSSLLLKETDLMIKRATASARKHGIKLRHGKPNPGTGDCAFEATIYNNNERACYRDKYEMSVDWYRRIWMTDMANRSRKNYNIYTDQQWQEGWAQMLVPGIYERGIFGDLMLPGIACGIRKIILIFNTNLNTPHDPIYVVNPCDFNVLPDTDIPIILAYNMSHYESMEPCSHSDIEATINLVKEYQEGRYRYGRADIIFLLTLSDDNQPKQLINRSYPVQDEDNPTASKRSWTLAENKRKRDDQNKCKSKHESEETTHRRMENTFLRR